jgi:hypothetical protein
MLYPHLREQVPRKVTTIITLSILEINKIEGAEIAARIINTLKPVHVLFSENNM